MSNKVILQLGDIIKLYAPSNIDYDNNTFYIDYLDNSRINIINGKTGKYETLLIDEDKNELREESIKKIDILSRNESSSYAIQNNLTPGTWIDIYFNGDLPTIETGQIKELDEDQIEIKLEKSGEIIYIDFEGKGIPIDLPIEKIIIREKPDSLQDLNKKIVESDEEEEELIIEDKEATISKINNILLDADQIVFGKSIGNVDETYEVSDNEKRFSIENQKNDLLDELLSVIPNSERTDSILNNIHTMIERYVQLRNEFSKFDKNGNANMPLKKGHLFKPLVNAIDELNFNLNYVLPVVKNRKKLYNIENDDSESDIILLNIFESLEKERNLYEEYKSNTLTYINYLQQLNSYFSPYEFPINKDNLIIEKNVNSDVNVIVDNLNNIWSSVAKGNQLSRKRFLTTKYLKAIKSKVFKDEPSLDIFPSDKIPIKSLLILPEPFINYSNIHLPNTDIMTKSNLNLNSINLWSFLDKKTLINSQIITSFNNEEKVNFSFKKINEYILDENIEENSNEAFEKFLNRIIPSTRSLFNYMKQNIKGSLSIYNILFYLQPFLIYKNDLTYKQYEDMKRTIEKEKIPNFLSTFKENEKIYKKIIQRKRKISIPPCLIYSIMDGGNGAINSVFEKYNFENGCYNKNNTKLRLTSCEVLNKMIEIDYGNTYMFAVAKINENLLLPFNYDSILKDKSEKLDSDITKANNNNDCYKYNYLTKKYIDIDDLNEDNDINIYFDKKYDPTFYDIINEYKLEKNQLDDKKFLEFLTNEMMKNLQDTNKASFEANSVIDGSRKVRDGDYAVLELINDDKITYNYYIRENNKWVIDEEMTKKNENIEPDFFCNSQNKCLKVKEECVDFNLGSLDVRKNLVNEIYSEFESKVLESRETTIKKINNHFEYCEEILPILINANFSQFLKYNEQKIILEKDLGDEIEENFSLCEIKRLHFKRRKYC